MQELAVPAELSSQPPTFLSWARSLAIATPEQFTDAGERLKAVKGFSKRVADWFKPMKQAQDEAKKRILDAEKSLLEPAAEAERLAKSALLSYTQEQQRKAEDERRRLQAIADEAARREREKIEQAAAKQRAIEAEQRAKAEAARKEAEAASDAERKKLLAEAEAADRKAASAAAKVEVQEEKSAAVVAPVVAVAPTVAPKSAGVSIRKTWKADVVDQAAFLAYVCDNSRFDLVLPNQTVLDALAKGLKEMASIPGVKFSEVSTMSARS